MKRIERDRLCKPSRLGEEKHLQLIFWRVLGRKKRGQEGEKKKTKRCSVTLLTEVCYFELDCSFVSPTRHLQSHTAPNRTRGLSCSLGTHTGWQWITQRLVAWDLSPEQEVDRKPWWLPSHPLSEEVLALQHTLMSLPGFLMGSSTKTCFLSSAAFH